MATTGMHRHPQNIIKPPPPDAEAVSELSEGAGHILSPPHGLNQYPTPSRYYYPNRPVSNWTRFEDSSLRTSGEEAVVGAGSRQ